MDTKLQDRTVVVTGGANGMGLASVKRLAGSGASVALCDLNQEAGDAAVAGLSKEYPKQKFSFKRVDVCDFQAIETWLEEVATEYGAIHGLVCCAGVAIPGPKLHEMSMDSFRKTIEVNQYGTVYFNAVALRHFVKQNEKGLKPPPGGYTILNMGSKGSVEGLPGSPAYTASKHAVLGLTRVVAKDYAEAQVRCNCLCPGLIMTPMMKQLNASGKPELSEEYLMRQCYSRRFGTPEEMANIVNYLIGPESSYITGQAIEADGMWSI